MEPTIGEALPSSGVMEKIKLPHSHVSALRPFAFANRKCLFKYSSLQHVPEPSEKPKMSTQATAWLRVRRGPRPACRQDRGERGPHGEFIFICILFARPRLRFGVGGGLHLRAPFVLRRVKATHLFTLCSMAVNVLFQAPSFASSPPVSISAARLINDTEFAAAFI